MIAAALDDCDLLLAIIGPDWLSRKGWRGKRRLADPSDFVHIELRTALEGLVHIIPVLVNNARMPAAHQLPPALKSLAYRQARRIVGSAVVR